ncbi:MAG: hypothetical protein IH600_12765 [Bacteroidetes bacterium]|nr:hypothetical protein [Bacteroidota bacterium]
MSGKSPAFSRVARDVLVAILYATPVFVYYAAHFMYRTPAGGEPTGFVVYDMPYYMANARQYVEHGFSQLFYANPFDYPVGSPKIYFQPLIYILGLLLAIHPSTPGLPFVLICFTATIAAFFILRRLLRLLYPDLSGGLRIITELSIAWGGGFLAIAGTLRSLAAGTAIQPLMYDPFNGLWFLNLGRNFIFPTEAIYHMLVLGLFLSLVARRHRTAYILLWLVAMSHPYTGLQFAMIAFIWVFLERQFLQSGEYEWKHVGLAALPLVFVFGYYLFYLPHFPSHLALMRQWTLAWTLDLYPMLGAYGIVGTLVLYRCRTKKRFLECFSQPFARFLAIMFVVSFVLANHEFFLRPRQPIHFTRGYLWTPLALLGMPVLAQVWKRVQDSRLLLGLLATGWLLLILSDNATFFAVDMQKTRGIYLTQEQATALSVIDSVANEPLLVSDNLFLSYLSTVYSSARPFVGHLSNTPDVSSRFRVQDTLFSSGLLLEPLRSEKFYVLSDAHQEKLRADSRFREIRRYPGISLFVYPSQNASHSDPRATDIGSH